MKTRKPILFSPQTVFHSGYISQSFPYFPFQVASGFPELQNVLSSHLPLTSIHLYSSPTHRVNEGLTKMSRGLSLHNPSTTPLLGRRRSLKCDLLCEQKWLLSQRKLSSEPLQRQCIHSRFCKICKINILHLCPWRGPPELQRLQIPNLACPWFRLTGDSMPGLKSGSPLSTNEW